MIEENIDLSQKKPEKTAGAGDMLLRNELSKVATSCLKLPDWRCAEMSNKELLVAAVGHHMEYMKLEKGLIENASEDSLKQAFAKVSKPSPWEGPLVAIGCSILLGGLACSVVGRSLYPLIISAGAAAPLFCSFLMFDRRHSEAKYILEAAAKIPDPV